MAAFAETEYGNLSKADLQLLANLDCGETYASELARRMKVSRQAIGKLLKNLVADGYVSLETDPKRANTKVIVITDAGRQLVFDAIAELNRLEEELAKRIGESDARALRRALEADWGDPPKPE